MFAKVRILPDLPFPCHVTMGYRLGALHLARAAPESPTGPEPEHNTADGIGRRKPGIRAAHPKTPRRLKQIESWRIWGRAVACRGVPRSFKPAPGTGKNRLI